MRSVFRDRRVVGGLLGAVIIAVVLALALGDGGDPDDQALVAAPEATYTPPALPDPPRPTSTPPGATPTPVPPLRAEAFALEEAPPGAIEFVRVAPGDKLNLPVYLVDPVTGAVEALRDPTRNFRLVHLDSSRLIALSNAVGLSQTGVETAPDGDLVDRATGKVYRWRSAILVALAEGKAIFRIPDAAADDWFMVVDLNKGPQVAARFRAEANAALISSDGKQAAVWGSELYIVDIETGEARMVQEKLSETSVRANSVARNTDNGAAFLVASTPLDSKVEARWVHYTWRGDLILKGSGRTGLISPSGNLLGLLESPSNVQATTYSFIDTHSGKPVFRITGVDSPYWYNGANRWLADESGIVIKDPSLPRHNGLVVAMQDGRVFPFVGIPTPDPIGVIALGDWASDAEGNVLTQVRLPDGSVKRLAGWDPGASEIPLLPLQRCCHGPNRAAQVVTPRVELPPYSGPALVHLTADMLGAEILDQPAFGSVIGHLGVDLVQIHEGVYVQEETPELYARNCEFFVRRIQEFGDSCEGPRKPTPIKGLWARVTTADGQQGWLLITVYLAAI